MTIPLFFRLESVARAGAPSRDAIAGREGPAALKEARLALLDAQRLHAEIALHRQIDRMGWRMDGKC